jgi:hypothetical protein
LQKILLSSTLAVLAIVSLVIFELCVYPQSTEISGQSFNTGANGLWLRYYWYFGRYTDTAIESMVDRLKQHQIKYAYFHVRNITADGSLKYHFLDNAHKLNSIVHAKYPNCQSIAWVNAASNEVDLEKPAVRKKMIEEAFWLVNQCGFDGVQWDYEFADNGDDDLVTLMRETKARLGSHFVGAATPMWYPGTLWGWSDDYIQRMAVVSDQLAVMCYDSYFYQPRAYVWLVEQQCHHYLDDAQKAGAHCKIMLGLPTYDTKDGTAGHIDLTENVLMGLKGVRQGLVNCQSDLASFDGVALFADYTTDDKEWKQVDQLWLKPTPK